VLGSSIRATSLTIKQSLIVIYNDVYDEHLFVFAAGLSYYLVLSLFPLMVSLAALLGYVPIPHLFEGLLSLMARLGKRTGCAIHDASLHTSAAPLLCECRRCCAFTAVFGGYVHRPRGGQIFLHRRMFVAKTRAVILRGFRELDWPLA
jgi:hypothetical protein